ncbi:MMPL family transporter [Gordonia phosphorivorans]|uniref:MMPL family transporter n=1 Tax=Gordonia phosphorivorans TaxID=1056982 RepID=A0ABV6HCF4_9ACTN
MSTDVTTDPPETTPPDADVVKPGPLARLGTWAGTHRRWMFAIWAVLVIGLGAAAPSVFSSLAGAGWQANGSESVQVRELAQEHFGGNSSAAVQVVLNSPDGPLDPAAQSEILTELRQIADSDDRFAAVIEPQPGMTVSPDGRTAIAIIGANASTDDMVKAVDDHKAQITELATDQIEVYPTGASALWSDFNKANHDAMIKAEMISWPLTLAIMVVAFGSVVAAGLPLLLTLAGLVASAGALVLLNAVTPISVWAMNFAMMFALALGIDYALFMVARFRTAYAQAKEKHGDKAAALTATAETMDTAGKAILLSGLTVLVSLSAVLMVPAPAVRTMAVGIMLAVAFVLAASLTLLPAVLAGLGGKVNAGSLPWAKKNQDGASPLFAKWGAFLDRRPWAPAIVAVGILVALAIPVFGIKVAMPSIAVVPEDAPVRQGYEVVAEQMGPGAPGMLTIVAPEADAVAVTEATAANPDIAAVMPAQPAGDDSGLVLIQAMPKVDPSDESMGATVDTLRADLPESALVGGPAAENLDLQSTLNTWFPVVAATILALGFLLLLVALRAPVIALLGTIVSLLSTAAAFGVAKLIFGDGIGADLLGFDPQGFLNGWGPVFFFAMIFAIAMDYTVFLLATAKEHYERHGDARRAQRDAMGQSGRIIFAAAAVMVAVFFSFALADPLPPKEMGIILGVAVLLDALLIRLILLPAILRVTGDGAWWCPKWLDRILPKISFKH